MRRSSIASSSDGVGEGVGVGDAAGDGYVKASVWQGDVESMKFWS